jgi:hypothetical protein
MSPIRKKFTKLPGCTSRKLPKLQIMKEAGWDERLQE